AQAAAAASQAASAARAAAAAAAAEARAAVDDRAAVQAAFQQAAQAGTPAPPDAYRTRPQVNGSHPAPAPVNGTRDPRIPTGFATPPPARPAVPEYRPPGVAIPSPHQPDGRAQQTGDFRAVPPPTLPPARPAPAA